jgi:hypothetical protein
MNGPVQIHSGRLAWSGEHWINALRRDESGPAAWVSLFHTRYSPAGEGNAAQVFIPEKGIDIICADNPELGAWSVQRFFAKSTHRTPDAPVVAAHFHRKGDIRHDPAWAIEFEGHRLVAHWHVTQEPVIAHGSFSAGTEHFTILYFTDEATIEFDGEPIEGAPYLRDIWQPSIGGMRSSCVIALAETLLENS